MPGPLQVIAIELRPWFGLPGAGLGRGRPAPGARGSAPARSALRLQERGRHDQRTVIGDDDFGALLSAIVPFGGAGLVERSVAGSRALIRLTRRALAQSLPPGTALAFLLVEHGWAQPLFDAIADTGGELLGEGFLTAEAGLDRRCRGRRDGGGG